MREYSVNVLPFDFISFKSITIDKEINCHSCATVVGIISGDVTEEYAELLMGELWVEIEAVGEYGERETLMKGIVTEFSIDHEAHQNVLSLTIQSGTYLMDVSKGFRTFQNASISYDDVLNVIDERYQSTAHSGEGLAFRPIDDFLFQYQETDWEFIKRLASRLNYHICPDDTYEGANYCLGMQAGSQIHFSEPLRYSAHKSISEYMGMKISEEISLRENDCLSFSVGSRDIYRIWDWTHMLGNVPVFVYKIESRYTNEELLHHYYLRSAEGLQVLRRFNSLISGCSFEASVRDIKQDLVQIAVHEDENTKQEITKWFKYSTVYSTPDGTGWYCMPEVGDTVRLYIPGECENDGYVISSVHLDASGGDRNNPDHKSIMNKYRKEILFTPDKLVLTNNKGISIEIIDNEWVSIISNKAINIKAKDSVTISSESASMTVAGTDSVTIKQGGASIQMDDDISFAGGEFRIQ